MLSLLRRTFELAFFHFVIKFVDKISKLPSINALEGGFR